MRLFRGVTMQVRGSSGEEYMPFVFNARKAIQAVAVLLKSRPDHTDNYMRLLKVLYIADRESIIETGVPITGDAFVAMEHGTMLSRLLNLAKRAKGYLDTDGDHAEWDKYIVRKRWTRAGIRLITDPGCDALCDYEVTKLSEVAKRYETCDQWAMRDETHKLPEYRDPIPEGKKQNWIALRDFLVAAGMGHIADEIEGTAKANASMVHLLGR
jgi:hypothetical protein